MKIQKIKALAPFKGYVVSEVSFEEVGTEIKLNFDKRCGPRCPGCKQGCRATKQAPGA